MVARAPAAAPAAPSAPAVNPHADPALLARYAACGHTSINAMMGGWQLLVPTNAGKLVCMMWALKGACNSTCHRQAAHMRYPCEVNQALSALMDACEVPNPQS